MSSLFVGNATLVLRNAISCILDKSNPWSEAVAINNDGLLMGVGLDVDIMDQFGSSINDTVKIIDF